MERVDDPERIRHFVLDHLLLRSGVALGEAVLMPTTISLIADLFPPKRRGLPVAVFTSVGSFMTIGSYAAGGAAIDLAGSANSIVGMSVWQTTLVIVGLPGLVLAFLFAITGTVPQRQSKSQDAGAPHVWRPASTWMHCIR